MIGIAVVHHGNGIASPVFAPTYQVVAKGQKHRVAPIAALAAVPHPPLALVPENVGCINIVESLRLGAGGGRQYRIAAIEIPLAFPLTRAFFQALRGAATPLSTHIP